VRWAKSYAKILIFVECFRAKANAHVALCLVLVCASTACTPLDIATNSVDVATAFVPPDTPTKQKTITIAPQTSAQATTSASTVPVPTAPSGSYLNVLDGNSIYPIEGIKNITLHAAPEGDSP